MPATEPAPLAPALFDNLPGLAAGFSTRLGGVSEGAFASLNLGLTTADERERVLENRRRLFASVGFRPDQLAVAGQVHGSEVREITAPGLFPGFDGMVTRTPGLVLCIGAADCAAVLLADPAQGVIGACHAGWRGAAAGITGKTIRRMEALGADASRLRAYISPCIGVQAFEVGPEVAAQFSPDFVRRNAKTGKAHVDLKAALADQLRRAGVSPAAIEVSPHCTFSETDLFFSHRAEAGATGRMMGFIGLKER